MDFLINAEHTSAFKPNVPAHSLFSLLICEGIFKNLGLKAEVICFSAGGFAEFSKKNLKEKVPPPGLEPGIFRDRLIADHSVSLT